MADSKFKAVVLENGTVVTAGNGEKFTIESFLGAGGQGSVYRVRNSRGEPFALKWYHKAKFLDQINAQAFYRNLSKNVQRGVPSQSSGTKATQFIWPLSIIPPQNGSFGYIMRLFPEGYDALERVLLGYSMDKNTGQKRPIRWRSYQVMLNAALNIVRGFEILHSQGLSYQDINEGGFSINTSTGDVFICDCDNVSPDKSNMGIRGVMNYMAPEVLNSQALPDVRTDEYSLAIILFRIFYINHPMEGTLSVSIRSDENYSRREADMRIYGDPKYCLNPQNTINKPAAKHSDVRKRCVYFPNVLLDAFSQVFTAGIKDPQKRLTATQWRKVLLQVLDLLVFEGKEKFYFTPAQQPLPPLARQLIYPNGHRVLLMPGKLLYACHFDEFLRDYQTPKAKVTQLKEGVLCLYNASGASIQGAYKGSQRSFAEKQYIPLLPGMTLQLGTAHVQVK